MFIEKNSVTLSLLDKLPTFRELRTASSMECNESLVEVVPSYQLYVDHIDADMHSFTGKRIFARSGVTDRLIQAANKLCELKPEFALQIHYGYRHLSIQKERYQAFLQQIHNRDDIPDKEQYAHSFIAEPSVAGHPTGGAVDVALVNRIDGSLADMGTSLREFTDDTLTFSPFISRIAWENRRLLRRVMSDAGFSPYDGEWWHFSYGDREWAYFNNTPAIYGPIEFSL